MQEAQLKLLDDHPFWHWTQAVQWINLCAEHPINRTLVCSRRAIFKMPRGSREQRTADWIRSSAFDLAQFMISNKVNTYIQGFHGDFSVLPEKTSSEWGAMMHRNLDSTNEILGDTLEIAGLDLIWFYPDEIKTVRRRYTPFRNQ